MLYSVQFLRGLAALLVVILHIVNKEVQNGLSARNWFNMGGTGVDLFFIISGFIMCYTTHDRQISCLRFIKHRIGRIIPLYWLLTTIALILYLTPLNVFYDKAAIRVLDSYFLLPIGNKYLVGTGWTLSYEFYFYFIFAVFLTFYLKSYIRYFFILVSILILTLLGWMNVFSFFLGGFLCNFWLMEFAFGIIAFIIFKNIKIPTMCCIMLILCGLPILIYQNFNDFMLNSPYRVFYIGFPMLLIFSGFLHMENLFKQPHNLFVSFLEHMGNSSYSLYLSHPFILVIASFVCVKLHFTFSVFFVFFLLLFSILFGFFVYHFIEQPMSKWIKSRF